VRRRWPWQAGSSWEYASVSTTTPHTSSASAWRFTSRQPISSGATCSAGRAKKDGRRCREGVVAMGVAWELLFTEINVSEIT